jgi:hypothetical protein
MSQTDFQIAFGDIITITTSVKGYKVEITFADKTYYPKFTLSEIFTVVFLKRDKAKVLIEASERLEVWVEGYRKWEIKNNARQTTVKYELKATDSGCDYKGFTFCGLKISKNRLCDGYIYSISKSF